MTPSEREDLRLSCLRILARNRTRFGLPTTYVNALCRQEGRPELTDRETEDELDYLAAKGLVDAPPKVLSPENRAWKLTASGRDYVAEHHLE